MSDNSEKCFTSVKPWAGNMVPPSDFVPSAAQFNEPHATLEIDHVYGYRARGARDNVHWIDEPTTFVYIAAAVAVVYNWTERQQRFFRGHTDDVCSLTFNRATRLAATGGLGKNNTAPIFIWNVDTLKVVQVLKGELMYGVTAVAFSPDGSRIVGVASDNSSTLALYDVASGAMLATSKGDSNRILHIIANTCADSDGRKSFVSIGISHVKFWHKNKEGFSGKKAIGGDIAKQTCIAVACSSRYVLAGNVSGQVYVFSSGILVQTLTPHTEYCSAISVEHDVIYSGGRDGLLKRWTISEALTMEEQHKIDLNQCHPLTAQEKKKAGNAARAISISNGKVVCGTSLGSIYVIPSDFDVQPILDAHYEQKPGSMPELWGLAAHPSEPLFATVSQDCTLRLWSVDLGSMVLLADAHYPGLCCAFSATGDQICVGHDNGAFSIWDAMTLTPTVGFTRKREFAAQCCAYSPDGRWLAIGMGLSHIVDIFDARRNYVHVTCCDALSGNIRRLDWNASSTLLRCSTASYEVVHFNVPSGAMNQSTDTADATWASQNCIIGWGVQGIWEGCSDGTDVNSVARSPNGLLLAAGYDMCTIRLYNFPCLPKVSERATKVEFPRYREYHGHSSHVTNCAFTSDGQYLLTCGGMDQTVIRWKVISGDGGNAALERPARAEIPVSLTASVQAGKIHELNDSIPLKAKASPLERSRSTNRRPGSGNEAVRSRLLETTSSMMEKARIGRAQRQHLELQDANRKRFAMY
jgi:microtubule-associated protein-like 6